MNLSDSVLWTFTPVSSLKLTVAATSQGHAAAKHDLMPSWSRVFYSRGLYQFIHRPTCFIAQLEQLTLLPLTSSGIYNKKEKIICFFMNARNYSDCWLQGCQNTGDLHCCSRFSCVETHYITLHDLTFI